MNMFSQLENMIQLWADNKYGEIDFASILTPFSPSSIRRFRDSNNNEFLHFDRFVHEIIYLLEKDIIYWLSPEKRSELLGLFLENEDIIVAVDLLACICEAYQTPPMNEQVVHRWQNTYLQVTKQAYEEKTF